MCFALNFQGVYKEQNKCFVKIFEDCVHLWVFESSDFVRDLRRCVALG